jgi:hypothetical protein
MAFRHRTERRRPAAGRASVAAGKAIVPGQKIHLYCLCWNDARMLPYFFRHYDGIVDKYFVFDNGSTDKSIAILKSHPRVEFTHFDVSGDSFVDEERRLSETIWRGSNADWVIITDIDEHIYHPNLPEYLRRCTERGVTAIRSIGYEMVSNTVPASVKPLVELVTTGVRSSGHDRLCIFNPRALTATNFNPGRHKAMPEGRVVWSDYREVLLLHYKQLGQRYLVTRSAELSQGLRPRDLEQGWGLHYTWSPARIRENWRALKAAAGPVPGLGSLKHVDPAKFLEVERTIERSGLVDEVWYLTTYPDVESAAADPLLHFCAHGWKEGRKPNYYFDPQWYCANYPELHTDGHNPLYDYVIRGEKEGACPSPLFDTPWYRAQHGLSVGESPLRHYLLRRSSGLVSPVPDFDVIAYCKTHPEVIVQGGDPFASYWSFKG